ncbi:hypothetical protein F511_34401 [Dorcoceras hygrometricum]|uniref:Uncharacterized protein n=1 Tax=Dorcoceras hygrometricum TaxID=472368 RepID=A0A2Z7C1P8_9LAMI|nr:hypothetical protein F511_34401 [Dorcoceras hygrometricum]
MPRIVLPLTAHGRAPTTRPPRSMYLCDPQWFRDKASRGSTTIVAPESQFRTCPSDHDSIGYPHMSASGESSTTMHRLLHASGSHPIPPPNDPKTNQYNQDLGLIHSTNGNHLESPNEVNSDDNATELIAFVTRGRDDKKGEVGSIHGLGQPPPGDGEFQILAKSGCSEVPLCVCVNCCKQGAKRCRFEHWSDVALLEIDTVHSNPISVDYRLFSPPPGVILVALSPCSLGLSICTNLETGVIGFDKREVVTVLESLCDCEPVVLLFFDSFGFELAVASAEWPWSCLGSELELVAAPFCCVRSVEIPGK